MTDTNESATTEAVPATIEVKRLNVNDIINLARIFQIAGKEAAAALVNSGGNDLLSGIMFALSFPAAEDEIIKLLASVTGKDPREIRALHAEDVLTILERLEDQENIPMVFTRVQALAAKISTKTKKQ